MYLVLGLVVHASGGNLKESAITREHISISCLGACAFVLQMLTNFRLVMRMHAGSFPHRWSRGTKTPGMRVKC